MNKKCLKVLQKIMKKSPGLRLGQIICNALPERFNNDPYLVTDKEMLEGLKKVIEMFN